MAIDMKARVVKILIFCALVAPAAGQAATVQLPRTGQSTCYDAGGAVIACAGTGQDGALQKGAAWPGTRFTDNGNGTVTDNLSGLIWLKNANCSANLGGVNNTGVGLTWANALTWSNNLASGACGLTDGSVAGGWRLPNIEELESLVDAERVNPALPAGHPFSGVQSGYYWSSSSYAGGTASAWLVGMGVGVVGSGSKGDGGGYVWPVRAGQ